MANTFNVADWVSMESLRRLLNKLEVASGFNTDFNKEYKKPWAVGDTVRVPLPQRYTVRNGMGYSPQPLSRPTTTVAIDQPFGIDFEIDDIDNVLRMERGDDNFKKIYIDPAMDQLAQEIDSRAALWAYQNSNNIVGVLGTDPTSFQTMNQARQRMVELGGWTGGSKTAVIPPSVSVALVNATTTAFNPPDIISKQFKDGSIGRAVGFNWYESMSLYSHTASTWAGAVTVNGSGQSGTSLNVTCTTGDTFAVGDVIGIGAVYAVNPSTRRRTTSATTKTVVVTQATVGVASAATLQIACGSGNSGILGPGSQYQNVDALPLTGATLTLFPGTASPNAKAGINGLAFGEDAFALVGVALEKPINQQMASVMRDPDTGIAIRFVRAWDPIQAKMINRFDTVIGFGNLYADAASVRILCA